MTNISALLKKYGEEWMKNGSPLYYSCINHLVGHQTLLASIAGEIFLLTTHGPHHHPSFSMALLLHTLPSLTYILTV